MARFLLLAESWVTTRSGARMELMFIADNHTLGREASPGQGWAGVGCACVTGVFPST